MGTAEVINSAQANAALAGGEVHGEAHNNIYGEHGPRLRSLGYCAIPSNGKAPIRSGFSKWQYAPKQAVVEKWAQKDPTADIVFVTGLTKTGYDCDLVIIDGDDHATVDRALDYFGDTPYKLKTRQGKHLGYKKKRSVDFGKIHGIRFDGWDMDVKHGQRQAAIAAAPPSSHEKQPDFHYEWDGCDEYVIRELPWIDERKIYDLLNRNSQPQEQPELITDDPRKASRHLSLNDYLCPKVWLYFPHDWSGFLAEAHAWNEGVSERTGKEALDGEGVMKMVLAVWHDCEKGKLKRMQGGRGVFRGTRDEMTALFTMDSAHGPDALALLLMFRLEHSARCEQGETFAICPFSMARDQVVPGWSRKRYEKARDLLLKAGLITCVSEYVRGWRTGRSARYSLV